MTNRKPPEARSSADESGPTEQTSQSLIDTLGDPDVDTDPAAEIEEKGEPFEGNHA